MVYTIILYSLFFFLECNLGSYLFVRMDDEAFFSARVSFAVSIRFLLYALHGLPTDMKSILGGPANFPRIHASMRLKYLHKDIIQNFFEIVRLGDKQSGLGGHESRRTVLAKSHAQDQRPYLSW